LRHGERQKEARGIIVEGDIIGRVVEEVGNYFLGPWRVWVRRGGCIGSWRETGGKETTGET